MRRRDGRTRRRGAARRGGSPEWRGGLSRRVNPRPLYRAARGGTTAARPISPTPESGRGGAIEPDRADGGKRLRLRRRGKGR